MKKIKFTCSNCHAKLRVPTHLAGISAPCPKCGRKITAPTDLDSIVDDEPAARSVSRPAPAESDAAPATAPAATAVADATTNATNEPALEAPSIPVPTAVATPSAPPAPIVEESPPLPAPVVEEPEPIIEETLLTPPAPSQVSVPEIQLPQKPLEKTQPIQINPLPATLPEVKSDLAGSGVDLPRLDADRVGGDNTTGLDALVSPSPGNGGPTRLHLPQPGDLNGQQSPGDFIVPPEEIFLPQEPVVEASIHAPVEPAHQDEHAYIPPPEPVIPDIADLDMSAPGIPMEELGESPTYEIAEENSVPVQPSEFAYPAEPVPPLENEIAVPEESTFPQQVEQDAAMIRLEQEEAPEENLSSGSMERMLSEQNQPVHSIPVQTHPSKEETAPDAEMDAMFGELAPESAGVEKAESSSLEEMFGGISTEDEKRKNLTKVVMLSMIGAVAIIAIIVVVVGINAAGGLSPQITSNQTEITPPPRISEIPPTKVVEPTITDAPAVIDPVAQERANENTEGINRNSPTGLAETSQPVLQVDEAPPSSIETPGSQPSAPIEDTPALSFDERVQQIVNGSGDSGGSTSEMNIIAGESKPSPLDSLDATIADLESSADNMVNEVTSSVAGALPGASLATEKNYSAPSVFPAPGPDEAPLGKTHDLLDAFLKAPDWQSRIPYIYQGESLRPAIEEYSKKWGVTSFERFSLQLFQIEQDTALGGPYWVYLVSTNDLDQGYPVIVRVEDGNLKVDWEIYSEFQDQHFVEFQKGAIASPHTFRLVIERVSDYYGSDREQFSNLDDYLVYQINPPYGDLSEYSEYAFVKKGSDLAREFEEVVGLNDEPLAVIVTIEQKAFSHGVKHLEITDYVTEGWFR